MSRTTGIEGIYWRKDNQDIWHLAFEDDIIKEIKNDYGRIGYRIKEKARRKTCQLKRFIIK